jgi:transposase
MEKCYSTDLSDAEWECLELCMFQLPTSSRTPEDSQHSRDPKRSVFYVPKSGCPWRLPPKDLEHPGRPSLLVVWQMAHGWDLRATQRRASYPYPAVPVSSYPRGSRGRSMQDSGYGVPRISIPRRRVDVCNGSEKDGEYAALQCETGRRDARGAL